MLINLWINEHDEGHPARCMPILVMDILEHAFMPVFGRKRADYIEAFFKNIDWKAVEVQLHSTGSRIEEQDLHSFTEEICRP